jgi:hypothetical protein
MKKLLIFSQLLLCLNCSGQSWTPKVAYWIYSAGYMFSSAEIRLSYLQDTLINGQNCQILKRDVILYDYINKIYNNAVWSNEVTYFNSGVTYILNDNKFDTLYYFSAKKNDKYKFTSKLSQPGDSGYAVVVDTGIVELNSVKLKWLAVDYNFKRQTNNYKLRDTIIEKIGSINYYYLPWDYINGMVDGNEGGSLKCYHDSTFGVFNKNRSSNCTFDLSLGISNLNTIDFKIFPNPIDNELNITLVNNHNINTLQIYSCQGQLVHSSILQPSQTSYKINTSTWISGIYFIIIKSDIGLMKSKIIIIHPNN